MKERILCPHSNLTYLLEPICEQLRALLPERETLVFGCAYERIADKSCSATTSLRRRRDEWIEAGAMEVVVVLREMLSLKAYDDKLIGLHSSAPMWWPCR